MHKEINFDKTVGAFFKDIDALLTKHLLYFK